MSDQQLSSQQVKLARKSKLMMIVVVVIIVLAGGAYLGLKLLKPSNDQAQVANTERQADRRFGQPEAFPQFQGTTTTAEELTVGSQVVVMGTANSDGSLTADIIRLGDFSDEEFQRFGNRQPGNASSTESGNFNQPTDVTLPVGFNPAEFQNMTPPERQARFQELRDSGQLPGFGNGQGSGFRGQGETGFASRASGIEVIRGEILKKDDLSITVKLADSGSRLVFYTNETRIMKVGANGE